METNNSKNLLKKVPWGSLIAIFAFLAIILLAAVVGIWFVLDSIAQQTHNNATLFDNWWQVLMFIVDILSFVGLGISIFYFVVFKEEKRIEKENNPIKVPVFLNKTCFGLMTTFFAVVSAGFAIGGPIANSSENFINDFLGIKPYEVVQTDGEEIIFNEYLSDYIERDELGNPIYKKNEDGRYVPVFNDKKMRDNSLRVATQVSTEGSVLLFNKNNSLPLKKDNKISFFGISSAEYIFSAAGSGHLGVSVTTSLQSSCKEVGLEVNPTLSNAYRILSSQYGNWNTNLGTTLNGTSIGDTCYIEYGIGEVGWNDINKTSVGNVTSSFNEYGDAAIMVISRNDGEDGDTNYFTDECIDGNYLDLAHKEVEVINKLIELRNQGVFKKVLLLINSANPMQMKNISKLDLDACVWLGVGGNVSHDQIARIISGVDNPSGRLIDTYLYDNYSSPSSVNFGDFEFETKTGLPSTTTYSHSEKYLVYGEGIYVGYRYFETRYEDSVLNSGNAVSPAGVVSGNGNWNYSDVVAYPFGYGSSYTTFEQSNFSTRRVEGGYEVSVTVKNTGDVAGKDVVQIYLQKPYTEYDKQNALEKPSVELVGYAKTKLLNKNESETLTVFVEDELFKSYDSYGYKQYILEAGDYYLASGVNAHDALNNILAKKGKTTADGMDYNGNSEFVYHIDTINKLDLETYKYSLATGTEITNLFDDADPKLYEGTKEQFTNFKYLSRSDWNRTYPTPVVMDVKTQKMVNDMQYAQPVEADPNDKMPTFGKAGSLNLLDLWGLEYDDPKWQELLDQVTWEEAVTFATYGGGITGSTSVNAPDGVAKDGPGGIGVGNENLPNIMCFPSQCNMAATFNDALIEELGNAFGMEILHVGYNCIYAPGANIHRSPFSGRNWEYYSEDSFISGKMLAAECRGLTNRGVITNTKHFLLNDQERNRYGVSIWANEQSIREVYAKAFEIGVRESRMNGIMSSFNRIGCYWAGKHKGLLTGLLREEWGFIGVVQTDAYVGTHMHRALAESVVAGNDYTMGGPNPTALDEYRNNATVALALRETVHRLLYTKLHSNTMNGLTTNSYIIYHTPWWKEVLSTGKWVCGYLAGISALLLVLSIIAPIVLRKKYKLEQDENNAGKKIKMFFDVISKPVAAISGVLLTSIIVSSIVVPLALSREKEKPSVDGHTCESICEVCEGCKDLECTSYACYNKCTCDLPCEHACDVCGLCLSETSTETKCQTKCGSSYSNSQTFEGEDSHVLLYGGDLGGLGYAKETGSNQTYIGGFNANSGAQIKYILNSETETKASLIVSVCKRNASILFTNSILLMVNNKIIDSKGVVPALGQGEAEWVTFVNVNLGCIDLKAGRNVITFTCVSGDVGTGFNFDKITIKSNSTLSWYEGAHVCDNICLDCGLCKNEQCTDSICANKCACDYDKQEFNLSDGEAYVNNEKFNGTTVNMNTVGKELTYKIKSTKLNTAAIYYDLKVSSVDIKINELVSLFINGKEVNFEAVSTVANQFNLVQLKLVELPFGHNEIKLVSKTTDNIEVKALVIGCNDKLEYVNPHEFLTNSDYVTIEGAGFKSSENCISLIENAKGCVVTFPIKSSKATTADLYFNLASRATPAKISDIWQVRVNGELIQVTSDLPNNGREYFTYSDVFMNTVNLKEGHNDITITVISDSLSINTNLRAAIFKNTDAELSWSIEGPTLNRLVVEAETTELKTIKYEGGDRPLAYDKPTDPAFGDYSGNGFVGGINECGLFYPGQASLTFRVNLNKAASVKLYFGAGISGGSSASSFNVSVDGTNYTSTQSWNGDGWYCWEEHYYGNIDLREGVNVITITIMSGSPMNLDYFSLYSDTNITQVL